MTVEQDSNTIFEGGDISGFGGFKKSGGEFSSQQSSSYEPPQNGFGNKLAGLIVRISAGLIKNKKQAFYVILALIGVIFVISIILLLGTGNTGEVPKDVQLRPAI